MLIKTSLIVFIIFFGQFKYIVMSDSGKVKICISLKKKRFTFVFVAKSEKT